MSPPRRWSPARPGLAAGTHRVEVRGEENRVLLRRDAPITVPMEAPLDLVLP